ncbi:MAG: alpha/beta hydrolase [Ruminococcaceae bacterium]|nr:alpha/beta hydrolase [Oscillospiraceae bacterium]
MLHEKITLSEKYPEATLTSYVCDNDPELKPARRPAMIVCPGGGYHFLSAREAEPIASKFFAQGMNTYILRYSIAPNAKDYAPLIEAALAIKYVRKHADEHNTDPDKVFICGFSAGGHLAASSGILWNIKEVRDAIGVTDGSAPEGINKPTGMVLSYPVITAGDYAHKGSIYNLCGTKEPTKEEMDRFSLELHVDETTAPAFVWHTVTDQTVPIQNTLFLVNALVENKVMCEAHIYPQGVHGLSLCNEETWSEKPQMLEPHAATWIDLAIKWIKDMF